MVSLHTLLLNRSRRKTKWCASSIFPWWLQVVLESLWTLQNVLYFTINITQKIIRFSQADKENPIKQMWQKYILCHLPIKKKLSSVSYLSVTSNVPSNCMLAEQNFSLLGIHFGHLSTSILYTRPVQHTHKNCITFNFTVLFILCAIYPWCN